MTVDKPMDRKFCVGVCGVFAGDIGDAIILELDSRMQCIEDLPGYVLYIHR